MAQLWQNTWLRLGSWTVLMLVVGVVISLVAFPGSGSSADVATAQYASISGAGGAPSSGGSSLEMLPLTVSGAVAAGWKDPVLCDQARGRFFQKDPPGDGVPHFLMYDNRDGLIGIYQFSLTEMPAPWVFYEDLQGAGKTIIDFPHWSLLVYFKDPLQACARRDRGAVGASGTHYSAPASERSYEAAPTPTPVPSHGVALEAAAEEMSALKSLSFALTSEPEGAALAPGLAGSKIEGVVALGEGASVEVAGQRVPTASVPMNLVDLGAAVGEVVRALQDPADAASVWIDNKPHRGLSGTVAGQSLSGLFPTVTAEAVMGVTVWLGDDGLVRRVHVEGVAGAGAPAEIVWVLDLGDFDKRVTIEPLP